MEASKEAAHVPVLLDGVLQSCGASPGKVFVDATVGLGGHAIEIARLLGPTGRLIAIDQDASNLEVAKRRVVGCPVDWAHANFSEIEGVLRRLKVERVDGVLADLGVASTQLDVAERGFSFRLEGPLDMRMDASSGPTAADLIAQSSEQTLARIFWEYGEERHSRRIAAKIVAARRKSPIRLTNELAELVRSVAPRLTRGQRGPSIDPATRVFQALRIAVNDELGALDALLDRLPWIIRPGGRAVVISFHSLEDRRVKTAFKDERYWRVLTKKPYRPTDEEINANPRARSAKLRAAERVSE